MRLAMITLPVADPGRSARFYAELCDATTVVMTPTHALLELQVAGVLLYLERRDWIVPGELTLRVGSVPELQHAYERWRAAGVPALTRPGLWPGVGQWFGGADPDGHRLRVLVASGWEHGCGPAGTLEPAPRLRQ